MMHKYRDGRRVLLGVLLVFSTSVLAEEGSKKSHTAYTAGWECQAFSGGDWLCRTDTRSGFTVPLDTIATMRSSIPNTLSALQQSALSTKPPLFSEQRTGSSRSVLSLSSDARRLIAMLQREEAFTILWYAGSNRAEADRMRDAIGRVDDAILLVTDSREGKEYVIVSGLFSDQASARRDLSKLSQEGRLAFLHPSPLQVGVLSRRPLSLPD
ncbi:hypothetical protein GCM10023116_35680 [Kistimonas scapharcae]|uniref:SPOR domain-containing protein n=1 Tax=Kistimonas scapharcae TaxID=1036133 RepID=A0ABP8V789_9GAMM